MLNAGGTLRVEKSFGSKEWGGVVVEHCAVKFVCSRLGDNRHLSNGGELGGVVGQVDLHLLKGLNVIGQRACLRVVDTIREGCPVDRPVVLVHPAAAEACDAAAILPLQT